MLPDKDAIEPESAHVRSVIVGLSEKATFSVYVRGKEMLFQRKGDAFPEIAASGVKSFALHDLLAKTVREQTPMRGTRLLLLGVLGAGKSNYFSRLGGPINGGLTSFPGSRLRTQ